MSRLLAVTALLAATLSLAGTAGAESRYSLRGDGEWVPGMRADARAMGGAEAASRIPGLSSNPASLSFAERTTFYGTYDTEWIQTDEGSATRRDYAGLVPNLGLIFPLPRGLSFGTGLLVSRRRNGVIEQNATVDDGSGGTVEYRQELEGRGSLLRIPALFAADVGGLQVGTGIDFMLLGSKNRWRNDFAEGSSFVDSDDLDEISLRGVAWRAGVRVPVREWFAIGLWGVLPSQLTGERRFESDQVGSSGDTEVDFEADFAPTWAAGVDFTPASRVRVVADWIHEEWQDAQPLNAIDRFVNVDRVAVGFEWTPAGGRGGLQWPVRTGYRTEKLHTLDALGNEVREHVLTAGSGFGIAGGRGDIDWYVEYGWRGVKDESEYREKLVRVGVTLTGWEKWSRSSPPSEGDDW